MLARQPGHLPVSPLALAGILRRAELPVMLEHGSEQHRPVRQDVGLPQQRLGQLFESQVGVGRDEVEKKGDVFHRVTLML